MVLQATLGGVGKNVVITITSTASAAKAASMDRSAISPVALSCDEPNLPAGRRMVCELRLSAAHDSESMEVALTSSTSALVVPATVGARAGQSRIRFEVGADRTASQETAVVEARLGSVSIQSSVALVASETPNLVVPTEATGTPQTPIQFTVTASDAQGLGVHLTASILPAGAVFDPDSGVLQWAPTDKDLGVHEMAFTATNALGAVATNSVKLFVDSGTPAVTSLENGVGSGAPAGGSPGSVATLRGHSLFAGTVPVSDLSGSSADLGGTRVLVNGAYVPVLYASASRVDLLCPDAVAGARLAISVETAAGQSKELDSLVQTSVPGLFSADGSGSGQALARRSGSPDVAAIPNARLSGKPALPDDSVSFLATGIDCSQETVGNLSLKLDQYPIPVTALRPLAGHAGICEIQVSIPASVLGDAVPARLQFVGSDGRKIESNETTISVATLQ